MRWMKSDEGAVAVVVALLAVALFGFAAIVIDVGAIYAERRQLQSGADAGALAVAKDCATSVCADTVSATDTAVTYGGLNDLADGKASATICGTGLDEWPDCSAQPALPPGVKYVRVTDTTLVPDPDPTATPGSTIDGLPPFLAYLLPGGQTETHVGAQATVAWGYGTRTKSPVVPFIMSVCEWQKIMPVYPGRPADLSDPTVDPGPSFPWASERQVFTHAGGPECTFNPSGQTGAEEKVPGDFGWLDAKKNATCTPSVASAADGSETVEGNNGTYASCVKDWLHEHLGEVIDIPIYADQPVFGNPTTYAIAGWAPFYLTGYNLGGQPVSINRASDVDPSTPSCLVKDKATTEADSCLAGFLVKMPPVAGPIVGPSFGLGTTSTTLVE